MEVPFSVLTYEELLFYINKMMCTIVFYLLINHHCFCCCFVPDLRARRTCGEHNGILFHGTYVHLSSTWAFPSIKTGHSTGEQTLLRPQHVRHSICNSVMLIDIQIARVDQMISDLCMCISKKLNADFTMT